MKRIRLLIFLALALLGCVSLARASFFDGVANNAPALSCELLLITGGLISFCVKIKRE